MHYFLRNITVLVVLVFTSFSCFTQEYPQSYYEKIDPEVFRPALMAEIILAEINRYREDKGGEPLDKHEILEKAADDQALYMATKEEASLKNRGNKRTTADRVILYGGTKLVEEIVMKASVSQGQNERTYFEVADEIVKKFIAKRKNLAILDNGKYIYAGVGSVVDYSGKKVYVSVVFGNHYSVSSGSRMRNSMDFPYTTKKNGLKSYDEKECKRCKKFENISELHEGLYVKDNKIYFKYDHNFKAFKKIIREKKDGLAVDVVQKSQYNCMSDNIIDYNLLNKGVMLKPMFSKAIYKNNMIPGEKVKEVLVVLGEIPSEINGDYELNLLVIQNKRVCKTITKTFIATGDADYFNPLELVPDTVTIPTEIVYKPQADTTTLFFIIPFEKGKYDYKKEDIEPLIKALNKPDFIILEMTLEAYSSIEGNDETNLMLQKKRAESIVNALKARQKDNFVSSTKTAYAWEQFKNDILSTKYGFLAEKSMEDAKAYIVSHNLLAELEPIFKEHRFAALNMTITYDIKGEKEQAFVIDKFNRTITKDDIPFAFSIQKYIVSKVVKNIYNSGAASGMQIPDDAQHAPFLVNKIFLEKISTKNKLSEDYCDRINTLHTYSPNNPYILFNKTCCAVFNAELDSKEELTNLQATIDGLYNEKLEKELVDRLNLDLQFKTIKFLDTTPTPSPTVIKAFTKIKTIVNLDETNWQNAMELAQLFIKYSDYAFALKLLEPFIDNTEVNEEFLYTYIGLCSNFQHKLMSNKFARSLSKYASLNPTKYCKLFDGDKLSFQVFDNPFVKEEYCKTCLKMTPKPTN